MRVPIKTNYPEEVTWVSFEAIRKWTYTPWLGFQYDWVSNELIEEALAHPLLPFVDLNIDWEDDRFLAQTKDCEEYLKHPLRVAKLVELITTGGEIEPVSLDTFSVNECRSCITNGHHRLRALQYLGYIEFPAYCSGLVDVIDQLLFVEVV